MNPTRFHNPRLLVSATLFALGAGAVGWSMALGPHETAKTLLVGGGLLSLSVAVPLFVEGLVHEHGLIGFRRGEALARWVVQGRAWSRFARSRIEADWSRARRRSVGFLMLALLVSLITLAVDRTAAAAVAVGGIALGLVPVFVPLLDERRALERTLAGAFVVIGPTSAWIDGQHAVWSSPEHQLHSVRVEPDRGVISMRGQRDALPFEVAVPYPNGASEAAYRVARQVQQACVADD